MPVNLAASLLMLAALCLFTATGVLVRIAVSNLPLSEVILLRQLGAMALMAPLYWRHRHQIAAPTGLRLHCIRGAAAVVSMACGLAATVEIPFADVTAIQMVEVVFVTILAALFLGEKVGWQRWTAAAVGFAGVIVMLRPFGGQVEIYMLVALVGAVFSAISVITLRLGSGHDSAVTVIFFQSLVVLVGVAPFAALAWQPPTLYALAIVATMSVSLAAGTWLFTTAFRIGNASAIAPLHYVRLLMMGVVGYLVYDERPSLATVAGAALILAAASYTLRRNTRREIAP